MPCIMPLTVQKTVMYITSLHMCKLHLSMHLYLCQSSELVSYLLHPFPGCMHLFASVGWMKVVALKTVPVQRHPALNGTKKASTQANKNNRKMPAQMSL